MGSTPIPGTYLNKKFVGVFYLMYYVYILYSIDFDRYYVGQCEDVALRLKRHNGRAVPSTKAYTPWKLIYSERFNFRAEAVHRETEIKKKKSRKYIEYLIGESDNRHVSI